VATFLTDTFSGESGLVFLSSHTGETGATWTQDAGYGDQFVVVNTTGRAYPGASQSANYSSGVPATAEYDIEADLICLSNVGNVQICARMDGNATMYMAGFFQGSGWQLYKQVAGSFTLLDTDSTTHGTSLTTSQTYELKFEVRDAAKKLFVDSVELLSSADNAITAKGKAGVRGSDGTSTTGHHLDNLTAYDPVVGGTKARPIFHRPHRFFRGK